MPTRGSCRPGGRPRHSRAPSAPAAAREGPAGVPAGERRGEDAGAEHAAPLLSAAAPSPAPRSVSGSAGRAPLAAAAGNVTAVGGGAGPDPRSAGWSRYLAQRCRLPRGRRGAARGRHAVARFAAAARAGGLVRPGRARQEGRQRGQVSEGRPPPTGAPFPRRGKEGERDGAGLSRAWRAAGPRRCREAAPAFPASLRGRDASSTCRACAAATSSLGDAAYLPASLQASRGGGRTPSESVPVPGPSGRPAPLWVGRGRKPFSALRNRYLHVSSSDPGRYRSPGASFWPGLAAAGRQLRPQAPGVAAAPALGQRAGECQVPGNWKGREDSNSALGPGGTACEMRSTPFLPPVSLVRFSSPARQ